MFTRRSFIKATFNNNKSYISFKKGFNIEVFNWIKKRFNLEEQDLNILKRFIDQALKMLEEDLNIFYEKDTIDSRYISTLLLIKD